MNDAFARGGLVVLAATQYAAVHHNGQVRKYTGAPYLEHPLAVAYTASGYTDDLAVVVAAILHDTVEDTDATIEEIRAAFGHEVARYVDELTDVYTHAAYPDMNRAARKEAERSRLASCSYGARLVKACDMLDNYVSITLHDPNFAKVYMAEFALMMQTGMFGDLPELLVTRLRHANTTYNRVDCIGDYAREAHAARDTQQRTD